MVQSQLGCLPLKGVPIVDCNIWQLAMWCCRRRQRWQVQGRSMLPTLHPGDQVLVHPYAYQDTAPEVGDIVLAQHPYRCELRLVKRIISIADDCYFLQGDNFCESTDSRTFQAIPGDLILGKVISFF